MSAAHDSGLRDTALSRRLLGGLQALMLGTSILLGACGGGGNAPPVSASIGAAGGSVDGAGGAQVVVPAGALAATTTVAIEQSAAGAPATPQGLAPAGEVYAFTPHGTAFALPVTVSIPADASKIPAGQSGSLYKTNSVGDWVRVDGATLSGGIVSAKVTGFSWFVFASAPPFIPPGQQPQNASIGVGDTATFGVTALGAPPFAYRWQSSADGGQTWVDVAGATGRTYATPAAALADDGTVFRVVVSNPDGPTTSQPATLHVTAAVVAPTITTQPASASIVAGASATFSVVATGTAPLHQWQLSRDGGASFADIAGATNASYTHTAAALTDDGLVFRVVVRNGAGSVTSTNALLSVSAVPPPAGAASAAKLGAGSDFSVALLADGTLRSWGSDTAGTLGDGGGFDVDRASPGPVAALTDVVAVDSSGGNTLALRRNGEVWGWGYNGFGALGNGSYASAPAPTRFIGTPALHGVRAIAAGNAHVMVLRDDGRIETSGFNAVGALGNPAVSYETNTAVEVVVTAGMRPIVAIAAGNNFSVALDEDGVVWTWGANDVGQLGQATAVAKTLVPQRVVGIDPVRAIAAGNDHVLAIARDGRLWSWGSNLNGKLGRGDVGNFVAEPGRVLLSGNIVAIAAGGQHSVSLHDDGTVFSWGINETGQLGNGSGSPGFRDVPGFVAGLPSGIRAIAAGGGIGHTLALGPDGRVWAWGSNNHGQIGDGTTASRLAPVAIPGLNLD